MKTHKPFPIFRYRAVMSRVREVATTPPVGVEPLFPLAYCFSFRGVVLVSRQRRLVGPTLWQWLARAPKPSERAATAQALSQAVHSWREHEFIHGDLSWHNIVITPEGPRFIDWVVDLKSTEVTPLFASPARLTRQPRTHADDLWSVNLIADLLLQPTMAPELWRHEKGMSLRRRFNHFAEAQR